MLTSGIIGGGLRNGRADLSTDIGNPDDGVQLRSNNRAGNRDTQSYVAALGGEWDRDNLNIVFEVSAAGSDTQETAFTSVFSSIIQMTLTSIVPTHVFECLLNTI